MYLLGAALGLPQSVQAASERSSVQATPYMLRHAGAVRAVEGGISMSELAQFMAHDDDRTTPKHHARYGSDHLCGVANAVGGALRGSI